MGLLDELGAMSGMFGGAGAQQGAGGQGGAQAAGAPGGGQGALVGAVLQMLQKHPGGIGGIVSSFQRAGLAGVAQSWIQDGPNQPVSPDQVQDALGPGPVGEVASKLGVSHGEAAGGLAQILPQILSHLSPGGQTPADGGLGGLGGLLSQLHGR